MRFGNIRTVQLILKRASRKTSLLLTIFYLDTTNLSETIHYFEVVVCIRHTADLVDLMIMNMNSFSFSIVRHCSFLILSEFVWELPALSFIPYDILNGLTLVDTSISVNISYLITLLILPSFLPFLPPSFHPFSFPFLLPSSPLSLIRYIVLVLRVFLTSPEKKL